MSSLPVTKYKNQLKMDQSTKFETENMKLLGEKLQHIIVGNYFLEMTLKVQARKAKLNIWYYIKPRDI